MFCTLLSMFRLFSMNVYQIWSVLAVSCMNTCFCLLLVLPYIFSNYRNMPIKGAPTNKGAPYGLEDLFLTTLTKIGPVSLIIDQFSIRNHHWRAQNLSFYCMTSDSTLLSRPAPLLGILRYSEWNSSQKGLYHQCVLSILRYTLKMWHTMLIFWTTSRWNFLDLWHWNTSCMDQWKKDLVHKHKIYTVITPINTPGRKHDSGVIEDIFSYQQLFTEWKSDHFSQNMHKKKGKWQSHGGWSGGGGDLYWRWVSIGDILIRNIIRVRKIRRTRRTCPANFENVRRRSLISPDKMSSEKFDICQTFRSEMSDENSKCPAKDCRCARQNVRRGSNEFRVLWT